MNEAATTGGKAGPSGGKRGFTAGQSYLGGVHVGAVEDGGEVRLDIRHLGCVLQEVHRDEHGGRLALMGEGGSGGRILRTGRIMDRKKNNYKITV